VLRRLAQELEGRVEFLLRGFPSLFDEAHFQREVAGIPHLRFEGPYRYPDELPTLYASVHLNWCFDFQDTHGNSRWLLPNRLYEGILHHTPALAAEDTATGDWIAQHQAGWTFPAASLVGLAEALRRFLTTLTPAAWQSVHDRCAALPPEVCSGEQDYARLTALLRLASPAQGPPPRIPNPVEDSTKASLPGPIAENSSPMPRSCSRRKSPV
jgi:hypothetical protein